MQDVRNARESFSDARLQVMQNIFNSKLIFLNINNLKYNKKHKKKFIKKKSFKV